jgi:hypothetical protein
MEDTPFDTSLVKGSVFVFSPDVRVCGFPPPNHDRITALCAKEDAICDLRFKYCGIFEPDQGVSGGENPGMESRRLRRAARSALKRLDFPAMK